MAHLTWYGAGYVQSFGLKSAIKTTVLSLIIVEVILYEKTYKT